MRTIGVCRSMRVFRMWMSTRLDVNPSLSSLLLRDPLSLLMTGSRTLSPTKKASAWLRIASPLTISSLSRLLTALMHQFFHLYYLACVALIFLWPTLPYRALRSSSFPIYTTRHPLNTLLHYTRTFQRFARITVQLAITYFNFDPGRLIVSEL